MYGRSLLQNFKGTVLILLLLLIYTGCGKQPALFNMQAARPTVKATAKTILIPAKKGIFTPFLLTIQPHTSINWQNQDLVPHQIRTTPQKESFLNPRPFTFVVKANSSTRIILDTPGLYHYYEPGRADWQGQFQRVKAKKGEVVYPLAMDGIIWVQGAIAGLPNSALNGIAKGHDEFTQEFISIKAPGVVAWHNFDEDPHFIGEVSGWSDPINANDIGIYRVAGTNDIPRGQTATIQFTKAGLYYYYCRNHDQIDYTYLRAIALKKASEYPLPMEGFVLVNNA